MQIILSVLFWTVILIGPIVVLSPRENRRRRRLIAYAHSLGLQYHDEYPPLAERRFYVQGEGASCRKGFLSGVWRGTPITYTDYRSVTVVGQSPAIYECSVARINLKVMLPYLEVTRHRALCVNSKYQQFATRLVDTQMTAWLMSADARLRFEVAGNTVAVSRDYMNPKHIPRLLDAAVEFAAHIPKAVLDDYAVGYRALR